jgi:hypothetical protein
MKESNHPGLDGLAERIEAFEVIGITEIMQIANKFCLTGAIPGVNRC